MGILLQARAARRVDLHDGHRDIVMSGQVTSAGKSGRVTEPRLWMAIAALATLAGLLLPQMLPGEVTSSRPIARSESKVDPPAESFEYAPTPLPDPPNFQAMMVRLGLGTAVVLGLSVVSLWGMRRFINPAAHSAGGVLQLVETLPLGNRCCLHLVRLGKREMVVGVDGTGIRSMLTLAEDFTEVLVSAQAQPPVSTEAP